MKHSVPAETTVVDFGAHFWPAELQDIRGRDVEPSSSAEYQGLDRRSDPETVVAEMREAGVDANVVSIPDFMGSTNVDATIRSNDALLEYVTVYDEFYGLASIPLGGDGDESAAEFERAIDVGFHGGGLQEANVRLTDDTMEPVLEFADRTGAPIFVHIPDQPSRQYQMNAIFDRERRLKESIARVIHDGIYDRYPNVNIVWHHLGGNIASHVGRIHLRSVPGMWPNQEGMKSFAEFKAALEERVYVDTAGFFGYTAPIRVALEEFPATQVLFGTDYPAEPRSAEDVGDFVNAVRSSASRRDVERILGANALDLLVNTG